MKRKTCVRIGLATALVAMVVGAIAPPSFAATVHARIEGTGSSWSGNAVSQWIADVAQQGLGVVFTPGGSAAGRKDFARATNDFAVTDIPFQGQDPLTRADDTALGRPYAYLPIVAGGTAFPYQIRVGGRLVRDLRLSGQTLAKIFTNQITNWNDPQITADNNGRRLPSLGIIPVLHSEGSGSTAQFTAFLAKEYPNIWGPFAGNAVQTEYFPRKGNALAPNGSDGVMNNVVAGSSNGAIGYDEYSYALNANYPVAKIENKSGYFTLPTDFNVAVSLTQAVINNDPNSIEYLIQKLDNVYTYTDVRTYPLSSYSYMLLPTGPVPAKPPEPAHQELRMTTAKRQTLVDFLSYAICAGQRSMGPLGYSPLPINLVLNGFDQIQKLKAVDNGVVIPNQPVNTCNNPTFVAGQPNTNHLAQIAPLPPPCDKVGAGPCAPGSTTAPGSNTGGSTGGAGNGAAAGASAGPGASGSAAAGQVDPVTGEIVGGNGGGDNGAVGTPSDLAAFRSAKYIRVLGPLAVVLLLAILFAPTLLSRWFGRRREES